MFYLPLLHVQGKKKGNNVAKKNTIMFPFSFFNMKRLCFGQNASFHFNKTRRQNASISKSILNLSFVLLSPQKYNFDFKN